MKIICISGKAGHGKDTVAGFIKTLEDGNGKNALIIHYADYLKHICKVCFGWDGEKNEAGRTLLQKVGTDVVRRRDSDFWVRSIIEFLNVFWDVWDTVIIPDCRFPNEISNLEDHGFDVTHLRVVRPDFDSGLTGEQAAHPSETEMDGIVPDALITNDGTLEKLARNTTSWYYSTFYKQEELL